MLEILKEEDLGAKRKMRLILRLRFSLGCHYSE